MFNPSRPAPFVLVSTDHGSMIVNQRDYSVEKGGGVIGVSVELFNWSHYDEEQLDLLMQLLVMRREDNGDGVVVVDGGANIGAYTLSFARMMSGWGSVLSFEPQERIFYALAGNIAINNCMNAKAMWAALGEECGVSLIPRIDYTKPRNFGGVSLRDAVAPSSQHDEVSLVTVDSFELPRLDMLKLDIEGMELEALAGARNTIELCKPLICVEHIHVGLEAIEHTLKPLGYKVQMTGMNVLGIHESDLVGQRIKFYDSEKSEAA